jgi:CHAT domain-containing protein
MRSRALHSAAIVTPSRSSTNPEMRTVTVAVLMALLGAARAFADSDAADAFARALEQPQVTALAGIAAPDAFAAAEQWQTARALFERFECMDVSSVKTLERIDEKNETVLIVELHAEGRARGPDRRIETLPRRWRLTYNADGLLSAIPFAEHVVEQLLRADESQRDAIVAEPGVSLEDITRALAERWYPAYDIGSRQRLARRLQQRAASAHDIAAQLHAAIALSRFARYTNDRAATTGPLEEWLERHAAAAPPSLVNRARLAAAEAWMIHDSRTAERHLRRLIADAQADPFMLFAAWKLLSLTLLDEVRMTESHDAAREAERLALHWGMPEAFADSQYLNGRTSRTIHDETNAHVRFRASADMSRALHDGERAAFALLWLARTEARETGPALALAVLDEALRVVPRDSVNLRVAIDAERCLRLLKDAPLRAVQLAESLTPRIERAHAAVTRRDAWEAVARVRRSEYRYEEAADAARRSLREGQAWILWGAWSSKARLGDDLRKLRRLEEAAAAYRESIELIEARHVLMPTTNIGAVRYFSDKVWVYDAFASLLHEMSRYEEALQVVEKGRTRAFSRLHGGAGFVVPAEAAPLQRRLNQRIVQLNQAIITAPNETERQSVQAELAEARRELEQFHNDLALSNPVAALQDPASPALAASPFVPDPGMAVVEYAVTPYATMIFVITSDDAGCRSLRVHWRRNPPGLHERVASLSRRVAARDLRYRDDARWLYAHLIAPVEPWIAGQHALCIIPDELLWKVPFQILTDGRDQPLVKRFAVSYAASLRMLELASMKRKPRGQTSLLAIGNPEVAPNMSALALDHAEREVAAIASLYENRTVHVRGAATESVVKNAAPRHRVLHFATHAVVEPGAPLYSALLLAPSRDASDDGRLEAREIAELRLDADLAILSACESAGGQIYAGEGMVGTVWAFLAAGCPTTVAAQWNVSSASTARLMLEFHRALAAGAAPAQALRSAQLKLMRDPDYSHPFYWAAFAVFGAP